MSPLQMELHTARQARLAKWGALPSNVVPIERVRPAVQVISEPEPVAAPVEPELPPPPPPRPLWFGPVIELPRKHPRVEDIQRAVAVRFNVSRDDLCSARRTANVVLPRQIAMFVAKQVTPKSLPEIGRRFGGRDHTTVLHAVNKIGHLAREDSEVAEHILALIESCARPQSCPCCGASS